MKHEQLASINLASWNLAYSGAEPVRSETLEQFAQKFAHCGFKDNAFYPCYGMAETTLFTTGGDIYASVLVKTGSIPTLENPQNSQIFIEKG